MELAVNPPPPPPQTAHEGGESHTPFPNLSLRVLKCPFQALSPCPIQILAGALYNTVNPVALRKAKIVYNQPKCTQKRQNCIQLTLLDSEGPTLYTIYPIVLRKPKKCEQLTLLHSGGAKLYAMNPTAFRNAKLYTKLYKVNPVTLKKAKIVYNFGLSECSRVKNLRYGKRDVHGG